MHLHALGFDYFRSSTVLPYARILPSQEQGQDETIFLLTWS